MLRRHSTHFSLAAQFFLVVCCVAFASCGRDRGQHAQSRRSTPLPERANAQSLEVWRNYLASAPPPRVGCFTTSYPSTRWREVPCRQGPLHPEHVGGRFGDYVAHDTPQIIQDPNGVSFPILHPIRFVQGSFPAVTGLTSETDSGTGVSDNYSVQINTNRFDTPACAGALAGCQGWEQFVYASDTGDPATATPGHLFIQYWLLNFGMTCPPEWEHPPANPANPNANPNNCFKNGPNQERLDRFPIAQLQNFFLIAGSGQRDTLIFVNSTYNFVYAIANDPAILTLGPHWTAAEFNVYGLHSSSEAVFNDGTSIVASLSMDHGAMAAPRCTVGSTVNGALIASFTNETNNLILVGTPSWSAGPSPKVVFTENTSGAPAPPSCGASDGNSNGLHMVYSWVHPGPVHFYTQDPSGEVAPEVGYVYDGAPFSVFSQFEPGTTEFFRFLCPNGHHYYTTDSSGEPGANICHQEQPSLGFIATSHLPGTTPLFRWYNRSTDDHVYTIVAGSPGSGYDSGGRVGFVKPGPGFY